jgi:hypothetical protein
MKELCNRGGEKRLRRYYLSTKYNTAQKIIQFMINKLILEKLLYVNVYFRRPSNNINSFQS